MGQRYYGRNRAYRGIAADIEDIVKVSEKRMVALMRASLQDVINEAQQSRFKGGRMRIDTGFLRASGQASLTGMPTGPDRPTTDDETDSYSYNESATEVVLGDLKFGSTFYFGWTASYARYRELYDGFLEGALQHWARIVAFNTDSICQRIKK